MCRTYMKQFYIKIINTFNITPTDMFRWLVNTVLALDLAWNAITSVFAFNIPILFLLRS